MDKRKNDTLTRYYYFKLAARYFNLEEDNKFLKISKRVLYLSTKSNDTLDIAKSCEYLADSYFKNFKIDSAFYYYSKAEKTFKKLKVNFDLLNIELSKANILYYKKDFAGAETATINVLKIVVKNKNQSIIYCSYLLLGDCLTGLNNPEKALEYYNKAFIVVDKLKDDPQYLQLKAQTYSFIGNVYKKDKNFKKAIPYYKKALKLENFKVTDKTIYANLIDNLAYSQLMLGDKKAINQLEEALQIRDSLQSIPGIVSSKINLAEYYLKQKDSQTALNYVNQAKLTAHANNMFEDELTTLSLLSRIEPLKSKFYNDRFIKLTDSLQTVERTTRNKFARIEFETNEIVAEKNKIASENRLKNKQLAVSLMVIFVLIMLGFAIYYIIIQKNRLKIISFNQFKLQSSNDLLLLLQEQQVLINDGKK